MRKTLMCLAAILLSSCGDDLGWDQKVKGNDAGCEDVIDTVDSGACNLCQDATESDTKGDTTGTPEDATVTDSSEDTTKDSAEDATVDAGTDATEATDADSLDAGSPDTVTPPECASATDCTVDQNPCTDATCESGKCIQLPNNGTCTDGDECTGGDICQLDKCVSGVTINCDDLNSCTDDSCDPATGCVHLPNKATCTDGDKCTGTDTCDSGACVPGKLTSCDDGNVCTDDTCDKDLGCVNVANAATCTDGDACTLVDHCSVGICLSGAVTSCDDGNLCTDDSCDKMAGCVNIANSVTCTDGDACTVGDVCVAKSCIPGNASNCEDNNVCTDDTCDKVVGCISVANSVTCTDGNACTTGDTCVDSKCKGGSAPNCDDLNPCTDDSCNSASGCVHLANTVTCNDDNSCTTVDTCQDKSCVGANPLNCDDNNVCTEDSCDPAKGCTNLPNIVTCTDDNVCTVTDTCKGGACVPGEPQACDDKNPCTDDSCDKAKGCFSSPNTLACNDNDACTLNDTCSSGVCGGTKADCDDGNLCTDDSCDPSTGCLHIPNTVTCTDNNVCTLNDTCNGGSCAPGNLRFCDDSNSCTDDACDRLAGCTHMPNSVTCSDGNACTANDTCKLGTCSGSKVVCDDSNVCTDDSCDSSSGCVTLQNSSTCTDDNACTVADACKGGTCVPGKALLCDDQNPCTDDSCDPAKGCVNAANVATCTDDDKCTDIDLCKDGACVPGKPVNCDDANPCTDDACSPLNSCLHLANAVTCTDDNVCTVSDVCASGSCKPGEALACTDGNPCTDDSCNKTSGCVNLPNTVTCNDSNACTLNDACKSGTCAGTAAICNDNEVCTNDSCDPTTGCLNLPNSVTCTDGDACTLADTCAGGKCKPGDLMTCPGKQCIISSCDKGVCVDDKSMLNDVPCDNGNLCTTLAKCLDGKCLQVSDKNCDDGNSCTSESCNVQTGACSVANVSDNTPCGNSSACISGVCTLVNNCGNVDSDGDGTNDKCDCEPLNKLVAPNLPEICDGADNNCNGQVDEGGVCGTTGTVKLSVFNSSTRTGLKDAVVNVKPANKCSTNSNLAPAVVTSTTDLSGKSVLKPDPNNYCVEVTLAGYKKAITSNFGIVSGEVRSLIVPLVPNSVPDDLVSVCGVVEDSTTKLPIASASVSVAVDSADNVVGTAKTDVTGLYCVTSLKSVNTAIVTALAEGYVSDTKSVTPPPNGVGIVQDFQLVTSSAGICYGNDFESGIAGWEITPQSSGNQWQVIDNSMAVKNTSYPSCVNVWPGEMCTPNPNDISDSCQICSNPLQLACTPSAGALPRSYKGTHAFWYGAVSTGNFNGTTQAAQCPAGSGGVGPANGGSAIMPEQTLPAGTSAYNLSFAYWYEIEGVAPEYPAFDSMNVYLSINGGPFSAIGHLNPSTSFGYQGPDAYTSGGGGQAPAWGVRQMAMTGAKAGDKVKVKFEFNTGDGAYNAFRGWVFDDLKILGTGCK